MNGNDSLSRLLLRRGLKIHSPLDCLNDGSTRVSRWRSEGQGARSVDSLRGLILGISVFQVKYSYVNLIKWEGIPDIR